MGKPTKIVGIAHADRLRGGVYEFWTDSGVHVSLHELSCSQIVFRPSDQSLILDFVDPAGNPGAVRMRFDGAVIQRWDADTVRGPLVHGGQVADLAWDDQCLFTLSLLDDEVDFTATCLTVSILDASTPERPS